MSAISPKSQHLFKNGIIKMKFYLLGIDFLEIDLDKILMRPPDFCKDPQRHQVMSQIFNRDQRTWSTVEGPYPPGIPLNLLS